MYFQASAAHSVAGCTLICRKLSKLQQPDKQSAFHWSCEDHEHSLTFTIIFSQELVSPAG